MSAFQISAWNCRPIRISVIWASAWTCILVGRKSTAGIVPIAKRNVMQ